ncbi:MAG TPA: hypothetical protein PLL33_02490 [Paracoccus sp. (in: a-proteobacteria)]|nr:hypothetical protein [Paracoccus sp. (in: a-proteobacteria)]
MNRFTELWRRLDRVSPEVYDFEDSVSQHQILFGIGWVVHEFEGLQETVLQLFSVVCGANKEAWSFRLSGVLAVTASFSMRVKSCREAAEQFSLGPAHLKALNSWLDLSERASQRRNEIVHGRLVLHQDESNSRQALIVPSTFDRRRGGLLTRSAQPRAYSYNPKQVQDYADAIARVNGNLITLMMQLAGEQAEIGDEWMLDPSQLVK